VERAVARGLARKERRIPEYIGVDEKAFAKRHHYPNFHSCWWLKNILGG